MHYTIPRTTERWGFLSAKEQRPTPTATAKHLLPSSSTKATLHLDLDHKADFLPPIVLHKVRENSRHLTKHGAIVVQSDESRTQHENLDHCFHRLYTIIAACVRQDLPGETTPEKHKHVIEL